MKADLHVHSKYSRRPSQWVLQKLGCPESFTDPERLYRIAREKGMSLVTLTDHNTIDGCLEIAHLPDVFVSEEVTTYFPVDGCKAHVLVYDINEAIHRDLQKVRENIHELVRFQVGDGMKLLYVGRISKEKDLPLLADAFQELYRSHREVQLIMVGDGPYLTELRGKMQGVPCTFTGYLEGEDLAKVFASCDLFVFPSTTDTFGNVVLEAQASGLPVVVTDTGGPHENIVPGVTGLVVDAHSSESLLSAIRWFIRSPQALRQMGRAARQVVEERSFEKAFDETWGLYQVGEGAPAYPLDQAV